MKKCLLIIDSHALIHRAYHALPKLTTKKGELVNAVYGFLLVFFKAINDFKPDYAVACFDLKGPTFRHKEFKDYKATRPKAPSELHEQIPKIKKVLQAFSVPVFEKKGFEADDIIATIVAKNQKSKTKIPQRDTLELIILTGDLDLLQLVDKTTKVYFLQRGVKNTVLYDQEKVKKRYNLSPALLADYKALVGDASDNIPGVPGIGLKTATKLLKEFGSLEEIYERLAIGNWQLAISDKLKEKLLEYRKQAFLAKKLAIIKKDLDLDFDLEKVKFGKYDKEKVKEIFELFGFKSLINRLSDRPEKNLKRLF